LIDPKLVGTFLYLGALLLIGYLAARRMHDVRDYFAGGKRFGFWSAAFSARATGESAWLLIGLTGMGAAVGVQAFWVVAGELLGVAGAWLLMCRRFNQLTARYDSVTIPDYLESRFRDAGHALRLVAAGALMIFVTIYVSAQIDATGKAFEQFLGWNYFVGAIVGFLVVLVYIVSGGFVAVVWSDVFQGLLMLAGLVALPMIGLVHVGGVASLIGGLRTIDPGLVSWSGPPGASWHAVFTNIGLVCIGIGFLGSPQIFIRFLALRSPREVAPGAAVALVWTVFADSGAVVIGLIGRVLFTEAGQAVDVALGNNGEYVLPMMAESLLPALLVGLFIAIVLSAIMSTIDSLLIVASSAAVRDYYQKTLHPDLPDDALVRASRVATCVLATLALAVAMGVAIWVPERTVFWFVIFGWSGIAATFCPTMILSLFWSRFTARGALAAMIVGFLAVPLFKFGAPNLPAPVGPAFGAIAELPPSFLVSGIAGLVVSLLDRPGRAVVAGVEAELAEAGR
jgi:sodium/proline symporter